MAILSCYFILQYTIILDTRQKRYLQPTTALKISSGIMIRDSWIMNIIFFSIYIFYCKNTLLTLL